jgi:hypothetical protein
MPSSGSAKRSCGPPAGTRPGTYVPGYVLGSPNMMQMADVRPSPKKEGRGLLTGPNLFPSEARDPYSIADAQLFSMFLRCRSAPTQAALEWGTPPTESCAYAIEWFREEVVWATRQRMGHPNLE